jgi:anaerobic magnesium-protoporphyrin IX monomethyl ester cyclase
MKILLINPPHQAIGSRLPREHLPPLGLLSIGGPLIDAGHRVELLDADYSNMKTSAILEHVLKCRPDLVLLGHSGSTSAQPIIDALVEQIKAADPAIRSIVGGVFPTYHWNEILAGNPAIDYIVCGEGEQGALDLVSALATNHPLENVKGIAFRKNGRPVKTTAAAPIRNLDDYRIAWELMAGYHYTYWGKKKAVVIQFSRGCPYPCSYCGQSLFWKTWRHRGPQRLADEIEMLHREYGVKVINFADENPSSNPKPWKAFLEALVAKNLDLILVGSIRADNIVRDAELLPLYKKAGFERFLLGVENYDAVVLERIKKAGSVSQDMEAIRLLRKHGILSMATYVVGFGDETLGDFIKSFRQLLKYDPDQVQLLYATPHKWTPYFNDVAHKHVIQPDQRKWDYKHQIMAMRHLKPWMVILCVKLIEVLMQTRPKALWRSFFHPDKRLRRAMSWYNNIGKRVWFYELFQFFFRNKHSERAMRLEDFWQPLAPEVSAESCEPGSENSSGKDRSPVRPRSMANT